MNLRTTTVVLIGLLMGTALSTWGGEPVTCPETHAGQQMSALILAMNSPGEEALREWVLSDSRAKDSVEVFERRFRYLNNFQMETGGLEIRRIEASSEYEIGILAKATSPQAPMEWIMLSLGYDSLPPYRLLGIDVQRGEDPEAWLPEGKLTDEELAGYLAGFIDELVAGDKFSGAILVARDGKPIFTRAAGLACKRYDVPNNLDTKFNLGSMNKMFTGVAIAQLAEQGKLSFDDPIVKYLPDYANKEAAEKVTIHHLLTHTSGMGSYWEELFDAKWWEIRTVQQLADLTAAKELRFEPGERFYYSNSGPIVLGLIIEKITGQSYYDYVRDHISAPAGMINSDCFEIDRPVPNLAIGYTKMNLQWERIEEGWYSNLFMHSAKGGPAGGGYSTVEDLFNFATALRGYKLLNEKYTDIVTTGKVDTDRGEKYAYLFGDRTVEGQRIVGHGGGAPGINAQLDVYWDSGYVVAVMANYDGAASRVAREIRRILCHSLGQP